MRLTDTTKEAEFRKKARDWLSRTIRKLPGAEPERLVDKVDYWRTWQNLLKEGGYAGLWWPREYGGGGADARIRAVFTDELDHVGAPDRLNTIGEDFIGPTIIDFGTEQQKLRLLPRILSGDDIWCQLFSEPSSGSDLASLRTKAQRTEGGWLINGQKVWTSRAHIAQMGFLLARTSGSNHRGLSCFILPTNSPGMTIRPIQHMLEEAEFNEVFFDDVFVPDENVVGSIDEGWGVAIAALSYERVAIATGRVNTQRAVDQLVEHLKARTDAKGQSIIGDQKIRQQVADLTSRALVHHLIAQRTVALDTGSEPPGPFASIGKLYSTPLVQEIAELALSVDDFGGQFTTQQSGGYWLRLANQARGTAIAGGTTFIQRNILAERMLGLPRSVRRPKGSSERRGDQ